jgi:hypothetical protein
MALEALLDMGHVLWMDEHVTAAHVDVVGECQRHAHRRPGSLVRP